MNHNYMLIMGLLIPALLMSLSEFFKNDTKEEYCKLTGNSWGYVYIRSLLCSIFFGAIAIIIEKCFFNIIVWEYVAVLTVLGYILPQTIIVDKKIKTFNRKMLRMGMLINQIATLRMLNNVYGFKSGIGIGAIVITILFYLSIILLPDKILGASDARVLALGYPFSYLISQMWVFVIFFVLLIYTSIHLHRKKQTQSTLGTEFLLPCIIVLIIFPIISSVM